MTDERKNCPMRHENGNCMSVGGFCSVVNDSICEGLRNAYKAGILADKAENNWHTGTPVEKGWYLVKYKHQSGIRYIAMDDPSDWVFTADTTIGWKKI